MPRGTLALAVAAVAAVTACPDGVGPAAPRPAAPVTTTAPAAPSPEAVAVPTCLGPEVRPEFFTSYCGDAGFQLTLTWDAWGAGEARAHGTAAVTKGPDAGWEGRMRVVFDRPRAVPEAGGRYLFSRAVITYAGGAGPDGQPTETVDLSDLWRGWTPPPPEPSGAG